MGLMMKIGQTILASHIKTELCILFYTSKPPFFLYLKGYFGLLFFFFFLIASGMADCHLTLLFSLIFHLPYFHTQLN